MENFDKIKSIIVGEIGRLKSVESFDKFLDTTKIYKQNLEDVKKMLENYVANLNEKEKDLDEIIKLISDLSTLISIKYKQFCDENENSVNQRKENPEDLKEKIELEKSQMKLKYLENNNNYFVDMLTVLKETNEKIMEIEQCIANAIAQEKICQDILLTKERQIDELKKKKEQEEMAKKEAEQKEIQMAHEATLQAELRKKEIEKIKKLMEEEENKKTEDKTENFTKIRYDFENGEFGDPGLACFIKVLPDFLISKNNLVVEFVDPLTINCNLDGTDEIVSNIIQIKSSHMESEELKFDQVFSVILPHTMSRTQGRETKILKYLQDQLQWIAIDTQDITMDDVDKSGARFVEAIFDKLPLILTVVSIPRIEDLQYGKKGCNWTAAVDGRVNIMIPQGSVKINLSMKITTLAFDSSFTQDVKNKSKGTNADSIFSFTHLLKIESQSRKLLKPITISLPLPQKPIPKSESGGMPIAVFGSNNDSKTKTNFGSQIDQEEKILLLTVDSGKKWVENKEVELEMDDKRDSIKYEINTLTEMIFIGVRAKQEASIDQISKGIEIIIDHFKLRQIKIIVAHHVEDSNLVIVTLCPVHRLDKQLRSLKEDGFNDKDAQISQETEIKEREILTLRFRGNIKVENENENYTRKFMYCSQLKNKVKIRLEVVDKYGQRAKTKYEGLLTVTISKWLKKPQPRVEGQTRKGPPQMIDVEEIISLYEALLSIPKSQNAQISKFISQEFHFISKDSVTEDFIKTLSYQVKEDWKQLAKALDLPANRIEEISSITSSDKNSSKMAYEVLKLWVMHMPVSKNKEKILNKALYKINRKDLVQEISAQ